MEESFWTKKQSCKLLKVDITKWHPFFVFVCFNGRHFLNHKKSRNLADRFSSLYFRKLSAGCPRDNIKKLETVISLNSFFFFQSTVIILFLSEYRCFKEEHCNKHGQCRFRDSMASLTGYVSMLHLLSLSLFPLPSTERRKSLRTFALL